MLQTSRILVSAISHAGLAVIACATLAFLTGCGQTGSLYIPTEPAAAHRATLPESLWPGMPDKVAPKPAETPAHPPSSDSAPARDATTAPLDK